MKIPRYWAHVTRTILVAGEESTFSCWQWSETSQAEAEARADGKAAELERKLQAGQRLDRYDYGDRPVREEVLQAIRGRNGQELAVLTRNAYGAVILNAARVMFIDIDFPQETAGAALGNLVRRWLGKLAASPESQYCQQVEAWCQAHPDLGIRLYRTCGGLRGLVTNVTLDPDSGEALQILRELGSDPLYIRLCQAQASFRARLTPKPWRCAMKNPPSRYPWRGSMDEARYRQWEHDYNARAAQFTTCRLIQQLGRSEVHPEVAPVLELHDRLACTGDARKLA